MDLGALINTILNFILIPMFNMTGAASATIISELCVAIILYFNARKIVGFNLFYKFVPLLLVGIICFGIVAILPFNKIISTIIFLIIYSYSLYLFKIVRNKELNLVEI